MRCLSSMWIRLQISCKTVQRKNLRWYVALYADETIPYREIVKILNIANENHYKMVLATRRPEK